MKGNIYYGYYEGITLLYKKTKGTCKFIKLHEIGKYNLQALFNVRKKK